MKLLKIISILMIIFVGLSCKKKVSAKIISNHNYYVKYVIQGNGAYGRFSNWSITTPQGKYTNTGYQTRSWNQTYGPVPKGFRCEVTISDYISGDPTIEIHVSKNNEPFALQLLTKGRTASYTISF